MKVPGGREELYTPKQKISVSRELVEKRGVSIEKYSPSTQYPSNCNKRKPKPRYLSLSARYF